MDAPRLPLSVLLLARDETAALEDLVPGLAFAREVVVVWDARGAEATRAAAERLGARVCARALDDFGAQRRFGLEQCREEWVLWIDADERLDAAAVEGLRRALGGPPPRAAAFTLERHGHFLGRRIRHCGWQGERVTRLFRRDRASFADARVHERVAIAGETAALPGAIEHHSYATWDDCARKLVAYARAGALEAHARGRSASALDVLLRPPLRFLRMYAAQLGFLDGAAGLLLCALAAAQVLLKYGGLWALAHGRGGEAAPPAPRDGERA
jgi:hypothetical protein